MSDESKKGSKAPFTAPMSPARAAPQTNKGKKRVKPISNRKQLRKAKKNQKSAISVRSLFTGLFILIATSIAVTAVISPGLLNKVASGELIESTETCKVEELNTSLFFDTSCGKFEWDTNRQPGTPITKLVKGQSYTIKSSGIRIAPAQVFPHVISYEKATK